jgi:TolB-like protein/DNA-binding winged helix-turn-helix (wHTH) protein/Tfp pilus assembly protein PilF
LEHYFRNTHQGREGRRMAQTFQFGDFTLDQSRFRLLRGNRPLRLEKRPMELLILLVERRGELVSRDEIAERLWGKDVFLDVEHGINTAVRKVRQALRDDPDKPRYVETVVGKGYRFAAPVNCKNGGSSLSAQVETLPSPPQVVSEPTVLSTESPSRAGHTKMAISAATVLALLTVTAIWYRTRSAKPVVQSAIRSIGVLPLKNLSGDPSQEYLADGMTEELTGRLSSIRELRVISRTSVMGFKDTKLSVPEIARQLNVDAVVEGSVMRNGNHIRIHAQLIRVSTDEHIWSEEYDRSLTDVLALQSDVAQSIADKVAVTITGQERARLVAARVVAPESYESYLKGMNAPRNNRAEIEQRIAYFQDAIQKDPMFAPAYVELAETYINLQDAFVGAPPSEIRPKAISAVRKALELDPELAKAHAYLAELYQKQWKWAESAAEYKRALELKPNDAAAHRGYADWLACQGRTEEAVAWVKRARELDPLGSGGDVAWILLLARHYDESIRDYRSALAVHPDFPSIRWGLGFALIANGQPREAIPVLETVVSMTSRRSPGSIDMLATAYALAGNRAEAQRLVEELKLRRQKDYIPPASLINSHLALGDYDQAFFWCGEAYKEQSAILQWIKVLPSFDPVRGDPRFENLLRRVGLD